MAEREVLRRTPLTSEQEAQYCRILLDSLVIQLAIQGLLDVDDLDAVHHRAGECSGDDEVLVQIHDLIDWAVKRAEHRAHGADSDDKEDDD